MKLQTNIPLHHETNQPIDYQSNIVLLGSCFVENIGQKFDYYKFKTLRNPFGILFHPKAIEQLIYRALENKMYLEEDVFYHNEQWHCYDAHSQLSSGSSVDLLTQLNTQLHSTKQHLQEATHVIITLGTAWVYRHLASNKVVANCHKVNKNQFNKELLSTAEISSALKHGITHLKTLNPKVSVLFTVSPVRHIKDGFVENSRSKSHLLAAVHHVLESESDESIYYFPSFEIMMDELRDYRFYAEDMVHPNTTAINYIWRRFCDSWISENVKKIMDEVEGVQRDLSHRPFNELSSSHQQFLAQLERKKEKLITRFPHMQFP